MAEAIITKKHVVLTAQADSCYLDRLREYVAAAEAEDASLAKKGERFAASFAKRQRRNLDAIIAEPESRRYRDYIDPVIHAQEGIL